MAQEYKANGESALYKEYMELRDQKLNDMSASQ
jgi:hypothetical protein